MPEKPRLSCKPIVKRKARTELLLQSSMEQTEELDNKKEIT